MRIITNYLYGLITRIKAIRCLNKKITKLENFTFNKISIIIQYMNIISELSSKLNRNFFLRRKSNLKILDRPSISKSRLNLASTAEIDYKKKIEKKVFSLEDLANKSEQMIFNAISVQKRITKTYCFTLDTKLIKFLDQKLVNSDMSKSKFVDIAISNQLHVLYKNNSPSGE